MEVRAQLKFYRQSPRKVRTVAHLVAGMDINTALVQLQFVNKKVALTLHKLIKSAVANATNNFSLDKNNLFIKSITVDGGPTLKRWRARAFGKSSPIKKRTSHVKVVLEEKEQSKHETAAKEKGEAKDEIKTVKSVGEAKALQKAESDADQTKTEVSEISKQNSKKQKESGKKGFAPKIFQRKSG